MSKSRNVGDELKVYIADDVRGGEVRVVRHWAPGRPQRLIMTRREAVELMKALMEEFPLDALSSS